MTQFNKITESIFSIFKATTAKEENLRLQNVAKQNKEIQKLVDAHLVACTTTKAEYMKGNSATNTARGEIKALFEGLAKEGFIKASTVKSYQNCFWIAFESGVEFSRDLANKKSEAKKAEGTAKADKPKSGAVEKTDMPALVATLQKALHQCGLLNQTMLKGALIDAIVEFIPEFTETPAK